MTLGVFVVCAILKKDTRGPHGTETKLDEVHAINVKIVNDVVFFSEETASLQKNQLILTLTLISGGRGSQRTAGSPSRNRLPETSWCEAEAPSLRQDGWMSCWKKRQKKWSSRGALSALQKALHDGGGERVQLEATYRTR